jgi:hypothetical protein
MVARSAEAGTSIRATNDKSALFVVASKARQANIVWIAARCVTDKSIEIRRGLLEAPHTAIRKSAAVRVGMLERLAKSTAAPVPLPSASNNRLPVLLL